MIRRLLLSTLAALVALVLIAPSAGAQVTRDDDNQAVAVNTQDGASLLRLAFSIVRVTDGVVDQTNTAAALASCTDCTTVALAFQVVLVEGDADIVVPENKAYAVNVECAECVTYASATQLVLGVDGPVRLTGDGMRRLAHVANDMRELERNIDELDLATLNARVQAAKQELVTIFTEELAPIGPPQRDQDEEVTTTTTTSTPSSSSTTTTSEPAPSSTSTSTTTSTTEAPTTSSTTTTTTAA